jgi:hypothetical protein
MKTATKNPAPDGQATQLSTPTDLSATATRNISGAMDAVAAK